MLQQLQAFFPIIIINIICGICLLLYGIHLMSDALKKANTKLIENTLKTVTHRLWLCIPVSIVITAIMQSSSAVTVMTIGFVKAGVMRFPQTMGIIYGANIGATFTAHLMSFNMGSLTIPLLCVGLLLRICTNKKKLHYIAFCFIGLGMVFLGLTLLQINVPYLAKNPRTYGLFATYGQNPYTAILIGTIATMIVQSSSATIGITIVLFNHQLIPLESALGLTMGINMGTCITALLASIKGGIAARRTAWAHTLYNVIGMAIFGVFLLKPFTKLVLWVTAALNQADIRIIANGHTLFNILIMLLFLPVTKQYVAFIQKIIPKTSSATKKRY